MSVRAFLGQFRPRNRALMKSIRERHRVSREVGRAVDYTVVRGPFAGMLLPCPISDTAAKLIGSYERELHPVIERVLLEPWDVVVNIGCSDGFYAVGLALRRPAVRVFAFDLNTFFRKVTARTADANGVAVTVGGRCDPEELRQLSAGGNALVFCDCEGCELGLITPNVLGWSRAIVELHPDAGTDQSLPVSFAATHAVELTESVDDRDPVEFPELVFLDERSQSVAIFERPYAQSWAYLSPRAT